MLRSAFLAAVTVVLLAACTSVPKPRDLDVQVPAAAAKPSASSVASTAPANLAALPPRAALFFKAEAPGKQGAARLTAFRVGGDGHALGTVDEPTGAGTVQVGDDRLALAPNGRWLAAFRAGRLTLVALDGGRDLPLSQRTTQEVAILISGWSPDSKTLLFHQGELQGEDSPSLPKDVKPGFYLASVADGSVRHLPDLSGFDAWESDSRHVVAEQSVESHRYTLHEQDIQGGAPRVLQELRTAYGFSQLSLHANELLYMLDSAPGQQRVVVSRLDGSALRHVTEPAAFADVQWPKRSPDGLRVAYERRHGGERTIEVIALTGGRPAVVASGAREFAWESASTLLVLKGRTLERVTLDGRAVPLAEDVARLAVAGE